MGISIELSFQCQPLINDTDNKSYFKAAVIIKNTIAALTSLFLSLLPWFILQRIGHEEVKPFGIIHGLFQFFGRTDFNGHGLAKSLNGQFLILLCHRVSSL